MSDINLQQVDIDRLIPYARNARLHTDAHVAELAGSIKEFGFNVPIVIDGEYNIIAGHGRVLAARKLGMPQVPAVLVSHLTDVQRRAFILADNKIHDNSIFDFELLGLELEELTELGFDLTLAGFDSSSMQEINFGSGDGFVDSDLGRPPENSAYKEQYGVIIMCSDAGQQQEIFERLTGEGFNCRIVTT